MKEKLRKRARDTHDNPHVAIGELTSLLSETTKYLLPSQHALKMMYKRKRISPPNPGSLEELQLDDDNIMTFSNRNFLLYDSGPGASRMLMFATKENFDFLSMSSIWLADGTFKTVPAIFCQLYIYYPLSRWRTQSI